MANKRTVRVLFSIEVDVPIKNPNTMTAGPGPVLFGFLEDAVNDQLSEIPGLLTEKSAPWQDAVGSFKLHSVEELGIIKPRKLRKKLAAACETMCLDPKQAEAFGIAGRVLCFDDERNECHPCPSCGTNPKMERGCPTCDPQ